MAGARSRNFQGWPLFANSFRPFFLLAAIQAGLSILVWLPMFYGELSVTSAFAPRDWHVHEMLYGFLPAVITGFLFTAIPNWTGRLPIQGVRTCRRCRLPGAGRCGRNARDHRRRQLAQSAGRGARAGAARRQCRLPSRGAL
jgi:uncharacterized protein involved in response to NO